MLDAIEKLLILQDRDRKLIRLREEVAHIPVERQQLQAKAAASQAALDAANTRSNKLRPTERSWNSMPRLKSN